MTAPLPEALDHEDEGWMWLPWEELRELQREKNSLMNQLIDNAAFVARIPEPPQGDGK